MKISFFKKKLKKHSSAVYELTAREPKPPQVL